MELPHPNVMLTLFAYVWLFLGLGISLLAGMAVGGWILDWMTTRVLRQLGAFEMVLLYAWNRRAFKKYLSEIQQAASRPLPSEAED